MKFGYVCENEEDARALRRIAEELVSPLTPAVEDLFERIEEICALLDKWENRNA